MPCDTPMAKKKQIGRRVQGPFLIKIVMKYHFFARVIRAIKATRTGLIVGIMGRPTFIFPTGKKIINKKLPLP